jgi:hypothetical protein
MASGPEHYRAAEALLQMLERKAGEPNAQVPRGDIDTTCAWAQVHATLALAAATIAGSNAEWREVLDEEQAS